MKTYKVRLNTYGCGYQVTVKTEDSDHAIVKALIENPDMKNITEVYEVE